MARTRNKKLYIAAEPTFGTDPDSDGSDYTAVPTLMLGDLKDEKKMIETNYMTGRPYMTAPIAGADGWSFECEVPVIGLGTAAGDGAAPPSADWFDTILAHIFDTTRDISGEGVSTGSSTSSLVLDTDVYNIQTLVPVYDSTLSISGGLRTQWTMLVADAGNGTYGTLSPNFATAPTTSGVAHGTKNYYHIAKATTNPATLAFAYVEDEVTYTCLGGRCTGASISFNAGEIIKMKLSFRGDTKTEDTSGKSSLSATSGIPAVTPTKGLLSPVYFNGTSYCTKSVSIDLGLSASDVECVAQANGRSNIEVLTVNPTVTIEPLRTNAILDLKRNVTEGRLLIQMGGGVLASSVLNTCAVYFDNAIAESVDVKDDGGRLRQTVKFKLADKVYFSGSTDSYAVQFSRA